eukprot:2103660-Prymnesium_polylepis.2
MAKKKTGDGKNKGQARKAAQIKKNGKQQKAFGVHQRLKSHTVPAMQQQRPVGISKNKKKQKGGNAAGAGSATAPAPPKEITAGVSSSTYAQSMRILLVGEGDLGFGAALSLLWGEAGGITATAYDDEAVALNKYVATTENVETLRSLDATVAYGVDATRLQASAVVRQAKKGYDRVVFNFPHAGGGIKDQARNIAANQQLMRGFFACVCGTGLLANGGECHVTLKRGQPYDSWNVVTLAKLAGLRVRHCTPFEAARFPGYAHRRTIGDEHAGDSEISSGKTYAFVERTAEDDEEKKGKAAKGSKGGKGGGKGGEAKGVKGFMGGKTNKVLQTGQSYKDAWKQRHRKGKR